MSTRHLLVLSDTEQGAVIRDEEDSDFMKLRSLSIVQGSTLPIVALWEVYAEEVQRLTEELRSQGKKVGVYGDREKADKFYSKATRPPDPEQAEEVKHD